MTLPAPLWMIAVGALLAIGGWLLYEYYLHPAWRKQRRVLRACEQAFDEGEYRLERLRMSPDDPSIADLVPSLPFGGEQSARYFTYKIETLEDAEPDFSGLSRRDAHLVRHYLRRTAEMPHHGKEVLRPRGNDNSVDEHSTARV